jgi:hypothetical protein
MRRDFAFTPSGSNAAMEPAIAFDIDTAHARTGLAEQAARSSASRCRASKNTQLAPRKVRERNLLCATGNVQKTVVAAAWMMIKPQRVAGAQRNSRVGVFEMSDLLERGKRSRAR